LTLFVKNANNQELLLLKEIFNLKKFKLLAAVTFMKPTAENVFMMTITCLKLHKAVLL